MKIESTLPSAPARRATLVWTISGALLLAAALGLWARHGTDVFTAMLVAGWTACFG